MSYGKLSLLWSLAWKAMTLHGTNCWRTFIFTGLSICHHFILYHYTIYNTISNLIKYYQQNPGCVWKVWKCVYNSNICFHLPAFFSQLCVIIKSHMKHNSLYLTVLYLFFISLKYNILELLSEQLPIFPGLTSWASLNWRHGNATALVPWTYLDWMI